MAPLDEQKTYWHLLGEQKIPSEYEIASSKLLYYPKRGFEVKVPAGEWYQKYQTESPFYCADWSQFRDPRETHYTKYNKLQKTKETFASRLLDQMEGIEYFQRLSPEWVSVLDEFLCPLRYPWHGFQMIAAYIAQMSPSSRIVIAGMFQNADEIRRVQRISYRMRQLQDHFPSFGKNAKEIWQNHPAWQPLRENVERLLVCYDWGEAFVGFNLVLKPLFDRFVLIHFAERAKREGDYLLAELLASFEEDALWQRDWSFALASLAMQQAPGEKTKKSQEAIQRWVEHWSPKAMKSVSHLSFFLQNPDSLKEDLQSFHQNYLRPLSIFPSTS